MRPISRTLALVKSAVSLTAETEIQKRSEHNHSGEEQEDQSIDSQSFHVPHPVPAPIHPKEQRERNHQKVEACQNHVGRQNKQGVLRNSAEQGLEVQDRQASCRNLECPAWGHGGIGRRTRLKIVWAEKPVGVQVPLPPPKFIPSAASTNLTNLGI